MRRSSVPAAADRPRTKDRPDYADADDGHGRHGRPWPVHRSWSTTGWWSATKARQLGRTGVIVGDGSGWSGDTSADGRHAGPDRRGVEERRTVLRRTADDDDPYERPIVANADQLVIVTALADPPPRTGMIDRILVAGFDAGIAPLLCLTKADLASPAALIAQYEPLGVAGRGNLPGCRPEPVAQPAGGPAQRLRRPLRCRQVHPGERPDPGRRTGHRGGQRGHRAAGGTRRPRRSRCGCPDD